VSAAAVILGDMGGGGPDADHVHGLLRGDTEPAHWTSAVWLRFALAAVIFVGFVVGAFIAAH
jgi:hypothetical protein